MDVSIKVNYITISGNHLEGDILNPFNVIPDYFHHLNVPDYLENLLENKEITAIIEKTRSDASNPRFNISYFYLKDIQ